MAPASLTFGKLGSASIWPVPNSSLFAAVHQPTLPRHTSDERRCDARPSLFTGRGNAAVGVCMNNSTSGSIQLSARRRSRHRPAVSCSASPSSTDLLSEQDVKHLLAAARLSNESCGQSQPHPNAACVLVAPDGRVLGQEFQFAQGTPPPEVLVAAAVRGAARGSTAYVNLEPGDCHGEPAAVQALIEAGVSRVVVGLRHPLAHLRGAGVASLRAQGIAVDVLGETPAAIPAEAEQAALLSVLTANEPLLHRAALRRPLSVLKYAMTLDGKIATAQGHSAWVSSAESRARVFQMRARSDAVIVGGNTVRRDNPRLTTRQEGGHTPTRIVMSRTLVLPEAAHLWDVSIAPTVVMTQRGARSRFQAGLRERGVEVVEFDFLTPENVAEYCQQRGYLQCFWECGGTLAAPSIASGVIHKVLAFVAPKIIGGDRAPTPVGDLGFVEMTQAVHLLDTAWQQVGPDLMLTGYLPSSGGLFALETQLSIGDGQAASLSSSATISTPATLNGNGCAPTTSPSATTATISAAGTASQNAQQPMPQPSACSAAAAAMLASKRQMGGAALVPVAEFYKPWDQWGCLSNFSPHPITVPDEGNAFSNHDASENASASGSTSSSSSGPVSYIAPNHRLSSSETSSSSSRSENSNSAFSNVNDTSSSTSHSSSSSSHGSAPCVREWRTVEHYYQAHKFACVTHADAQATMRAIHSAPSPEAAACIGRRTERDRPELVRKDWPTAKLRVMHLALTAKFAQHAGPREMLLSTAAASNGGSSRQDDSSYAGISTSGHGQSSTITGCSKGYELVEASPNDYYWGLGFRRTGQNHLGKMLMRVRGELLNGAAALNGGNGGTSEGAQLQVPQRQQQQVGVA